MRVAQSLQGDLTVLCQSQIDTVRPLIHWAQEASSPADSWCKHAIGLAMCWLTGMLRCRSPFPCFEAFPR